MSHIKEYEFKKYIDRYRGDMNAIKFNCLDRFLAKNSAQYNDRSGLRDIVTAFDYCDPRYVQVQPQGNVLVHLGKSEREEGLAYLSGLC